MEFLTNAIKKIRRKVLNGKEYLIANMVLIVPGVLPGSRGPLYYPPEEVADNPSKWDNTPLVLDHPVVDNANVSASYPGVKETWGLGVVKNTRYVNGKLVAEGWFEVNQTRKVDKRLREQGRNEVLPKLLKGETIELSTGLFTKNVDTQPSVDSKGRFYSVVATKYIPDHVAILPDKTGACSRIDGCGVLINSNLEDSMSNFSVNGGPGSGRRGHGSGGFKTMSHGHISSKLKNMGIDGAEHKAFKKLGHKSSSSVERGTKITTYSDDKTGSLVSVHERANKPSKVYYAVRNQTNNQKDIPMKVKLIKWLTTNCDCWKDEGGNSILNKMSEARLRKLVEQAKKSRDTQEVVNSIASQFSDMYQQETGSTLSLNSLPDYISTKVANATFSQEDEEGNEEDIDIEESEEGEESKKKPVGNKYMKKNMGGKDEEDMEGNGGGEKAGKKMVCSKCGKTTVNKQGMCANCGGKMVGNMTEEEWLNNAPPRIKAVLNTALKVEQREKTILVNKLTRHITDNKRKEELTKKFMNKDTEELETLVSLLPPTSNRSNSNNDEDDVTNHRLLSYFGAGGSNVSNSNGSNSTNNEILPDLEINWSNEEN